MFDDYALAAAALADITIKNTDRKDSESVLGFNSENGKNTAFIKSDSEGSIKIGYDEKDSIKLDNEQIIFNLDTNISN